MSRKSFSRRRFFKAAGTAGLALAAVELFPNMVGAKSHQAPGTKSLNQKNIILTNVSLIDSIRPDPQLKATVVVHNGRIVRAGTAPPSKDERSESPVIDLGGAWVLPGLCDAHAHFISPLQAPPGETLIDRYLRFGSGAMDALKVGITSARVVGAPDFCDIAWRKAFARGTFLGPRLFCGGHTIVPTAGHGSGYGYGQKVVADGPIEVRRAVREQIQADVDLIKIVLTGGVFGHRWDSLDNNEFLPDEIEAAFETARQRGYKVAAHAGNAEAVKLAAQAGAHSIEHGYALNEEAIQAMVNRGTIFVPTLCVTFLTEAAAESEYEKDWTRRWPMPTNLQERANQRRAKHLESFKRALAAGVKIASGADHSPLAETAFLEVELLVRCGMTPMQAIIAATRVSTEAAAAGAELGTIESGKLADLLVVTANPLDNIHNLRKMLMVLKEGEIVVDKRQ